MQHCAPHVPPSPPAAPPPCFSKEAGKEPGGPPGRIIHVTLEWRDLSYSVTVGGGRRLCFKRPGRERRILDSLSAAVPPGRLLAIMGECGAAPGVRGTAVVRQQASNGQQAAWRMAPADARCGPWPVPTGSSVRQCCRSHRLWKEQVGAGRVGWAGLAWAALFPGRLALPHAALPPCQLPSTDQRPLPCPAPLQYAERAGWAPARGGHPGGGGAGQWPAQGARLPSHLRLCDAGAAGQRVGPRGWAGHLACCMSPSGTTTLPHP